VYVHFVHVVYRQKQQSIVTVQNGDVFHRITKYPLSSVNYSRLAVAFVLSSELAIHLSSILGKWKRIFTQMSNI